MIRSVSEQDNASSVERLALPLATAWSAEQVSDSPFAPFVRLATRCTDCNLAVLVLESASSLQLHAYAGTVNGEALPVSVIRAQMARPRRLTVEIADLTADPVFEHAPPHEQSSGFAAYAGATIRNPAGVAVGVLCLLATEPRRFGREILLTLTDLARGIAALLAAQRESQHMPAAAPDAVTGLPGRQALEHYLEQNLEAAAPGPEPVPDLALFRIDFGRLATLNDMYGRDVADRFLAQAADRLHTIAPVPSFLAHLGGSGFVLATPGRIGPSDAEAIALRMMERLREPVQIDLLELPLRPSVGVALHPLHGAEPTALLLAAEAALAHARTQGDGRHCHASSALTASYALSTGLQQDLQAAVTHGGFHLNWMPVIDTATEQVISFEALVRWNRPGHGEMSPDLFIPVAEAGGLIEQLDAWVLNAACAEASSWQRALGVAVNVSPVWLSHGRLPKLLRRVLDATGLEPNRLQIEISERGTLTDEGAVRRELSQVRAMGVRLALDDFGTGYSSLAALTSYPFDQVKLDRRFVRALGQDRRAEAITRSVLQMVQALGMTSCAEGVETEEQLAFLDAHGCEEIQGYLIGRPVPHLPPRATGAAETVDTAES